MTRSRGPALSALAQAQRSAERAAALGFDWAEPLEVLDKWDEEREELADALRGGDPSRIQHELGDLLLTAVNLARKLGVSAEEALSEANARFDQRFGLLLAGVRRDTLDPGALAPAEWEARWQAAKAAIAATASANPVNP